MKRLLLLPLALLITTLVWAQTNVYLSIDHKLGNQAFAFQTAATNNLGNQFDVKRLQYYISSIELVHDGGTVTPVTDKYMLVNANDSTYESLGSFNVTNLEAIRFGIGVDAAKNHLNPASYPSNHPLAPKSPSMHWGWAGGYRYMALEGKAGSSLSFTYELHTVDTSNYFIQTIATSGNANGNDLVITLIGDYTRILENINVSSGIVVHGSGGAAREALINFAWHVFTSSEGNAAMDIETFSIEQFSISPNPASRFQPISVTGLPENSSVLLTDITGRKHSIEINNGQFSVSSLPPGMYFLSVLVNDEALTTRKFIIK